MEVNWEAKCATLQHRIDNAIDDLARLASLFYESREAYEADDFGFMEIIRELRGQNDEQR